jgi:hypothetical protein
MRCTALLAISALFVAFAGARGREARGEFVKQILINGTGKAVNDLHLRFTNGFIEAKTKVVVTRFSDGMSVEANPTNGSAVEFPKEVLGEIPKDAIGNRVSVKFDVPKPAAIAIRRGGEPPPTDRARINALLTEWTIDGMGLGPGEGVFTGLVRLAALLDPATDQGFVQLFNESDQVMIFSDIRVSSDNDLANFNVDSFDTATGAVIALPTVTVGPNQVSDAFPLGVIDPSKFFLITANATASGGSGDVFALAAAEAVVPEPGSLTLILLGLALAPALIVRSRAHRRSRTGRLSRV